MVRAILTDPRLGTGILSVVFFASATLGCHADTTRRRAEHDSVRQILAIADLSGGLIVHLGCGDGRLTAALRPGEGYLVHGLDTDADNVRHARQYLGELGIYGPVSAERFDGRRLPYADNLVNLIVADDLGDVAETEAIRVLAPGGAVCVKKDGRWTKTVKPRPKNIDEWTHYTHDASGNAVAHDEVVGPPGRIQWNAEPRYMRSHEHTPGIFALVSSGGRIFYIVDQAPTGSVKREPRWNLMARDAFNGIRLWQKPFRTWFPHLVNWGQTPRQLQRKLVAVGDRVYVTLGMHAPLSALDAATGEILKVHEKTEGTEEIILHKGTLLLFVRSPTEQRIAELEKWKELVAAKDSPLDDRESAEPLVKRLRATEAKGTKKILALDAVSGRVLWNKTGEDVSRLKTGSLCADGDRAFYQNGSDVVGLDLKTGRKLWSASAPSLRLVCGDSVFCADGKTISALSIATGETRWQQVPAVVEVRDVFVAGGSLWVGGFKPIEGKRSPAWGPYFATQRDLATGKRLMHVEPENPGHHHRCYSNKATDRYILGGRRGTEFIDLESGDVLWNSWARGVCRYGIMPCNGLLYAPPHACGCYMAAKLTGFNALAPRRGETVAREAEFPRLQRGPAYDSPIATALPSGTDDWPTYRHDAQRSGCAKLAVPAALRRRWQVEMGGRISPPTVAQGKVFAAGVDEHRIAAVDADGGRILWQFTAGARVDSPPTLHQGRAIFGCRDGHVYSVRVSDGALAWCFRAARQPRLIAAGGQLESASPAHGSVLIRDAVAYVTAGRSSYTDGGIELYRLEPGSGKVLSKTTIYSPDPETGRQPKHFAPARMAGARSDILSSDGDCVYLRDMVFDMHGDRKPKGGQPEGNPHLFTLTDFLDGCWTHRSYWIFGTQCSVATGCSGRDRSLIYGRLLVHDESAIYGYGRKTVHWSNQLQDGPYRLFAVERGERTPRWEQSLALHVRAMLLADKVLFVAGVRAHATLWPEAHEEDPPGLLMAVSASDGTVLAEHRLDCSPVFDGMAAAGGRLYISLEHGRLVSME